MLNIKAKKLCFALHTEQKVLNILYYINELRVKCKANDTKLYTNRYIYI